MRLLLADGPDSAPTTGSTLDDSALVELYAWRPRRGAWVRCNFAASIDGAITGPDGRSASVNSEADHLVFGLLRALSDVVVVGAGTLRTEGYTALTVEKRWQSTRSDVGLAEALPLVCVSGSAAVPPRLVGAPEGAVLMATHTHSPGLSQARELLGSDQVLECGTDAVDDRTLVSLLEERGWTRILCEGGPHLASSMVAAGVLDEVCLSITPVVVGGEGPRMTTSAAVPTGYHPRVLVEEDGTVIGRWLKTGTR